MIYDWGGVGNLINNMTKAKQTDFASRWESIAEKAQTALEKTIESYKAME